jgi:pimeloyl-ACP methyl ester carboxylesterase
MLNTLGAFVLVLVAALALLAASFPLQWWNISLEDLRARYQRPESRYITIDGAEIHYQDEGDPNGVPVVLLHGNFGSLRAFDEWPDILGDRYRVIRFDIPVAGLSGFDTSGDYSIDRRIFLMNSLLAELNVHRYFIVATSFNGPTAFRAAAREPARVIGMVLGNAGGLPRTPQTNPNQPEANPVLRWLYQYYRPRSFFDAAVPGLIPDPAKRGPETAEQFHLMVTAKGRSQEGVKLLKQFDSSDAQAYLERVTCPVLLQWTTRGDQRLLVDKDLVRFQAWLINAPEVKTIEYDGAGHMLFQNAPEKTAADARAFMDSVLAGEAAREETQTGAVAGS